MAGQMAKREAAVEAPEVAVGQWGQEMADHLVAKVVLMAAVLERVLQVAGLWVVSAATPGASLVAMEAVAASMVENSAAVAKCTHHLSSTYHR